MKINLLKVKVGENFSRDGESDITSLVKSMETYGLQQPIVIDVEHNLVAGFRRFKAAQQLGWEDIECVITNQDPCIVNFIENLERENLSFYEECLSIRKIYEGCSTVEVAAALGRTTGWSRPRIGLWTLPEEIIEKVRAGELSCSKVTMLLNAKDQQSLIEKLLDTGETAPERVGKKTYQALITVALERGLTDVAHAFRFVVGDITEEELWDELDK